VTEANGYTMPCLPSEHGSILSIGLGPAQCRDCGATYPGNYVLAPDTPPPFAWAREVPKTVCACEPRWPQLMVMLSGQWYLGYPGNDGPHKVDGAAEGAFCRECGAYFLGDMVVDPDDTSHLVSVEDE